MTARQTLATVGLLGGGVIGGGWAARFVLNGIDVKIYDMDPQAERKVGDVMANARRAYGKLTLAPLPGEGKIIFVATPEEAVTDVDFVQESAPEQVALKQALFAKASRAARPDTVFGSSTSGILPTQLQRDMVNPERLVVGHPFNPVYLLPLVEICGGDKTSTAARERAREVYESIGMRPLMLQKEIDGFIADRLMESLWREALAMGVPVLTFAGSAAIVRTTAAILRPLGLDELIAASPEDYVEMAQVVGAAGLVVPEGNVPALAEVLQQLVDDAGRRAALGAAARARVEAHYTHAEVARKTHAFLRQVVAAPM